jgi:hypothetical protein
MIATRCTPYAISSASRAAYPLIDKNGENLRQKFYAGLLIGKSLRISSLVLMQPHATLAHAHAYAVAIL